MKFVLILLLFLTNLNLTNVNASENEYSIFSLIKKKDTIEYSNGDTYIGYVKNGKPHGKGTYNYSNGSFCKGTFKNGNFYECVWEKSTNDYSDSKLRKYLSSNRLFYEVDESWANIILCKVDKKQKKMFTKFPSRMHYYNQEWQRTVDNNEIRFCLDYLKKKKKIHIVLLIFSIPLLILIIYWINLFFRNRLVINYNLKHKTKFKKYSDYKKHIDKIKSKELKKDEKSSSKLEKTENLDDENLMGKVKRLRSLYNNGTLTKAEFEKAKNKLLK
jgi:hypothetical protein